MKKCPFCAEEIMPEAIKCKHCGENISSFVEKEKKALQSAVDQKKVLKVIGICVAVLVIFIFWYLAIPAVAAWYFFFNKNGKRKLRIIVGKAKQWSGMLMPHAKKHWKILTPMVAVLVVLVAVRSAFAPAAAAISLHEKYEFAGDYLEVAGGVRADCRCDVRVWVNNLEVPVTEGHTFSAVIPMAQDANAGKIAVLAKATGGLMYKKTVETTTEAVYQRQSATVEILNTPLESGDKQYTFTLKGDPHSVVTAKNEVKTMLDAQGNGTMTVPFNNAYNVQSDTIALVVSANGYMDGNITIEVKNLKYDTERVAKEKAAENKRLADAAAKERARARMRSNPLEFIEMVENNWYMGGFGSIPIHTITLKNKGEVPYKDIGIAVTYSSNSDTLIDVGAHVIYDILPAGKTKTFREINMGFMDGQASKSRVEILSAKIYE